LNIKQRRRGKGGKPPARVKQLPKVPRLTAPSRSVRYRGRSGSTRQARRACSSGREGHLSLSLSLFLSASIRIRGEADRITNYSRRRARSTAGPVNYLPGTHERPERPTMRNDSSHPLPRVDPPRADRRVYARSIR